MPDQLLLMMSLLSSDLLHLLVTAGVKEAGWTPEDEAAPPYRLLLEGVSGPLEPSPENLKAAMGGALTAVRAHADAWPFLEPVSKADVPDYYDIIKVFLCYHFFLCYVSCLRPSTHVRRHACFCVCANACPFLEPCQKQTCPTTTTSSRFVSFSN